ncbi:MAG: DNA methyltransferase [bacterium]
MKSASATSPRPRIEEPLKALNAICPYYTMFPLDFPLRVLRGRAQSGDWVVDPFCGRGTTNYAARLLGLSSVGVDSSPVAVALTKAKLADARVSDVVRVAVGILDAMPSRVSVPQGEFWERAFESSVLRQICWLRKDLLRECSCDSRVLLRAILLGALHGPRTKSAASHLSNQCPRTFAPKPDYAVRFWRKRRLKPPVVDVVEVIKTRARRYLSDRPKQTPTHVVLGDSRVEGVFGSRKFRWAITSPPYYGMRTYIPDQWLRNWFLGGPAKVAYRPPERELDHGSAEAFAADLRKVWKGISANAAEDARLVIRFGGIADRDVDPVELLKTSLNASGWRLTTTVSAGDANAGRRQATQFVHGGPAPKEEHDFYAVLA